MPRFRTALFALLHLLLAIATSGCISAPWWSQEVAVPRPQTPLHERPIVVAGFLTAERVVSVTQSANIRTILESASAFDASPQLAEALRARGLNARAVASGRAYEPTGDEVLVRGAVVANDTWRDGFGVWSVPYMLTLGLFGLWAPSPFSFEHGYRVMYRVEAIDAAGNYLLSAGPEEAHLVCTVRNLCFEPDPPQMFRKMREDTCRAIAAALGK